MSQSCFQCGKKGTKLYGYTICDSCKSKLGLFTDETIKKYHTNNSGFEKEINNRFILLDTDYKKKKLKLLHVKDRLKKIKNHK